MTWIKDIVFGKQENRHTLRGTLLVSRNKFSDTVTFATAWLAIHLFSTRACKWVVLTDSAYFLS